MKVYHSQGKDDWGTPGSLYHTLDDEFHFDLDVAANQDNAKCPAFLSQEINALEVDWWGRIWLNPPFSLLDQFIVKMIQELVAGHIELGVMLIASRTDTQAMFTASSYAGEIRYLKGRVSFTVAPTPQQRAWAENFHDVHIEPDGWPMLVKEVGLPKTALKALLKNPYLPPGHASLSIGAPFPSTVLVFDRRPVQTTAYWDWKQGVRTVYVYGEETTPKENVILKGDPKTGWTVVKVPGPFGNKLKVVSKGAKAANLPLLEFLKEQEAKMATLSGVESPDMAAMIQELNEVTMQQLTQATANDTEATDGTTGQD